jgi:hypothetical protein
MIPRNNKWSESVVLFCRFGEETAKYEKTRDIKLAEEIGRELLKLRSKDMKLLLLFLLQEFPYANKKFVRKSTLEVQVIFHFSLGFLTHPGLPHWVSKI